VRFRKSTKGLFGVDKIESNEIVLTLPYPVSANRYWRIARNRLILSKEAKAYKNAAKIEFAKTGAIPMTGIVVVVIILHPKLTRSGEASKVRIDLDNALKVVIDALNGLAYIDDKQIVGISATVGEGGMPDGGVSIIISAVDMRLGERISNSQAYIEMQHTTRGTRYS
jgi:crossover junction endodeoxyribonuclease RusA